MPVAALRLLALITVTAVTLVAADIPIYPGAKLDVEGMKLARSNDPAYHNTDYLTPDSFDKVYAFYLRQPGATEEKGAIASNRGRAGIKLGAFTFKGGIVTLSYPRGGFDPSHTGIEVDTLPPK